MLKAKDERIREAQGQKSRQTARLNELRVLQALIDKPLTFSELLKETGFSKPVLTKHLKTWVRESAICKDTIKPDETTNPKEVGKIVYRSNPKELTSVIVKALEHTLQMPKPDWDEEMKTELKIHFEGIAKLISREWEALQMKRRAKLKQ
jgi:DNA-binding transcriptional regulator GbsR (MarR family)